MFSDPRRPALTASPVVRRYVYNYLGGKHDNVLEELLASACTYGVAIVWLGPGPVVLTWAFFNCFGLNFELWTAKFFAMEPFASLEVGHNCLLKNLNMKCV